MLLRGGMELTSGREPSVACLSPVQYNFLAVLNTFAGQAVA